MASSAGFARILAIVLSLLPVLARAACTTPTASQFKVDTLIASSTSSAIFNSATDGGPFGMTLAPDGSIFMAMIGSGKVMVYRPVSNTTVLVGTVPSAQLNAETGFNGIALDPSYPKTHWIYTFFIESATTNQNETVNGVANQSTQMRSCDLIRYTVDSTQPAGSQLTNAKTILSFKREAVITQHMAGGLSMGQDGTLVFGTGDNSNYDTTKASDGFGPAYWPFPTEDSQRSSANTNDLRGKIIRIKPIAFPDNQTPDTGVGKTYTIPSGNLREKISTSGASVTSFIPGWDATDDSTKVRPEIYDFGVRVPLHARVDSRSGWIFWGDVGPNAAKNRTTRGPAGHDEWNLSTGAYFFGHPYCNGYNSAYNALTNILPNSFYGSSATSGNSFSDGTYGLPYDCATAVGDGSTTTAMVNNSPNNTGIHHMPPAQPSLVAYAGTGSNGASNSTDDDVRFNSTYPANLGTATPDHVVASAFGGPMYRYDPGLPSTTKFPPYYEGTILFFDFIRQNLRVIKINADGSIPSGTAGVEDFPGGLLPQGSYTDMQYGPDGALYVLRYSASYVPTQTIGTGGGLYRIRYNSTANPYDNSCYTPFAATVGPSGAASVPNVPTNVAGTPGNAQASLSWSAPSVNGGASITSYTATATQDTSKHCTTADGSTTTCNVSGLTGGTAYTFTVTAANSVGTSNLSAASASVTPAAATVPGSPAVASVTPANAQVTVTWTAPASNGGSVITGYTATAVQDASKHCATTGATNCIVTGLTNGNAYTFTVTATNAVGTGAASTASPSVTPATVPGAPVNIAGTPGNGQATVFWTTPSSNGGSAITGYAVTAFPNGATCASNTGNPVTPNCVVAGLSNGTAYTFTVIALNGMGSSAASAASLSLTPLTAPNAPASVTGTVGNGQATLSWTPPASNSGSPITRYTVTSSPGNGTCSTDGDVPPAFVSNKYSLAMGPMSFTATAKNSGRVTSLQYAGNEVLNQDSSGTQSTNYGSTFWPSPQKYWTSTCRTANNSGCFPPSIALDGNTYSAAIGADSSIMMWAASGDNNTNLRLRKNFWANIGDSSFNIRYTLVNTSSTTPDTFAPWEDTRIPAGGLYLFPNGQDTVTGNLAGLTKDSSGVTWFRYDSNTVPTSNVNKFYSDGSAGWFAHIDKNRILFIKKFYDSPVSRKAPSPEDEIELYTSNDKKLIEMEAQGPFAPIAANDSVSWDVKWYVRKIPDTLTVAVGNTAIVNYINQILGASPSSPGTACTITGLTNGQGYTFTAAATNSAGKGTASAASAVLTPSLPASAPAFAAQPHDTAVTSGSAASFMVSATGNGTLSYQWQKNAVNISAATSSIYSIPAAAVTDTGSYAVIVTDSLGNTAATNTSNAGRLTVNTASAPAITTQPHDTTVTSGSPASFSIAATTPGKLTYQWKKNGSAISNATSATYSIAATAVTDTGSYTVIVTDSLGNTAAITTSNSARLTVNTASTPTITTQPHDTAVTSGSSASFSVAVTGNGTLSYQWKKNGTLIFNATLATYSIAATAMTDTGSYTVVVTDSLGNTAAIAASSSAKLTVNTASTPTITTQPHDTAVTSGSPASFSAIATGNGTLGYLWRKNGNSISGAASATYFIPNVAITDTGSYTVLITDSLGNPAATNTSNAGRLIVNTASTPTITTQPHDTAVTSGSPTSFSIAATGLGKLTYQWKKNGSAISNATSATYSVAATAMTDTGSYTVVVTDSLGNTAAITTSNSARLTVNTASTPTITTQPHDTAVTSGSSASFSAIATGNGTLSYLWKKNGNLISGAASATYFIPNVAITDTGSYTLLVTDSLGNTAATVTSNAAKLMVSTASTPIITAQPHDTTITSGSPAKFLRYSNGIRETLLSMEKERLHNFQCHEHCLLHLQRHHHRHRILHPRSHRQPREYRRHRHK